MAIGTVKRTRPSWKTMADLLERLGNIPPARIWLDPHPGTATEKDVIAAWSGLDRRLCELVQGTLVEKPMGTKQAGVKLLWLIDPKTQTAEEYTSPTTKRHIAKNQG